MASRFTTNHAPGEDLFASVSMITTIERIEAITEEFGEIPWAFTQASSLAIPVPPVIGSPRERWKGINPALMRHPMFWLPERLAYPREEETIDHWVLRVALEVSRSAPFSALNRVWVPLYDYNNNPVVVGEEDGIDPESMNLVRVLGVDETPQAPIYDPSDGSWLDLPGSVGCDLTTAEGITRIKDWMDGLDDPALDSIDMDTQLRMEGRPENWADACLDRPIVWLEDPDAASAAFHEDLFFVGAAITAVEVANEVQSAIDNDDVDVEGLRDLAGLLRDTVPGLQPGASELASELSAIVDTLGAISPIESARRLVSLLDIAAYAMEPVLTRLEDRARGEQAELVREMVTKHGARLEEAQ